MKSKEKENIKKTKTIVSKGIQILNGKQCYRYNFVPIILIDYENENGHSFARGQRFALWIKLEDAQYKQIVMQLNKNLKELTLWFTKEQRDELAKFLNNGTQMTFK